MLRLGAREARRRLLPPGARLDVLRTEVVGRGRVRALVSHGLQGRDQRPQASRMGPVPLPQGGGLFARRRRAGGESGGAARRRTPPPQLRGAPSGDRSTGDLTGALSRATRTG